MASPTTPVTAKGLRKRTASGRSPMPFPKKRCGVTVSKDSAPTLARPVPPTSQETPAERMVSCASLLRKTYLRETSMLSKPVTVRPSSGSRILYVPASETPKLGVSLFENSAERSVSRVGGPPSLPGSLRCETVRNDSSSATNGSSTARVAGKKRWPARPWAAARAGDPSTSANRDSMIAAGRLTMTPPRATARPRDRGGLRATCSEHVELARWRGGAGGRGPREGRGGGG